MATGKKTAKSTRKPAKRKSGKKAAKPKARSAEQIDADREIIAALLLKRVSLRKIGEKVKLSHTQVDREILAIRKIWAKRAEDKLVSLLHEDLARLELIEAEAWQAWAGSFELSISMRTVTTEKHAILKNEDGSTFTEPVTETKTTVTEDAGGGEPRYLIIIKDCIVERHRLVGTYDRKDEDTDDPVEAVRLEEHVYLPGVGELPPEVFKEMMSKAQGLDLWHLLESLLPNQNAHVWHGDDNDSTAG